MNTTAEVFLWDTRVGIVHQDTDKKYASFEYDKDFIKSGIEVSPIMMPLNDIVYEFPTLSNEPFFGMPGLLADSLPDNFGNKVIEHWLISQNKSLKDFSAIDRLCYTGKRGMGALEYKPVSFDVKDKNENINVSQMVEFASMILAQRDVITLDASKLPAYTQLVQIGSSAGGARAKALIAWNEKTNEIKSGQLNLNKDFDYWLMKFDNVNKNGDHGTYDDVQYTLIEYAYYKMALDAGIIMNECRLYVKDNENHFMTKRFDRNNGNKVHMQSLGGIAHISYQEPCLCSYETAVRYMKQMNIPFKDIEQFFVRMVFNCLAVNCDDHVKNVSFLMNKKGEWSLSPAYDITFAYNPTNKWLNAHQMTINNKNKNITLIDLIDAGLNMGINKNKCIQTIESISKVVARFDDYARQVKINENTIKYISEIMLKNRVI